MPGINLTRDEAAERARMLESSTYDISLDLTTSDTTFASTTVIRFRCCGARRLDLRRPGRRRRSTRSPSTAVRSTRRRTRTAGSRSTDLAGRQRAARWSPTARTATPARACTASSTRSTSCVYLYTQFEVPDARRVFTTFEQPDLKAIVHLPRHRAVALAGRVQLPDARAGRPRRWARSVWHFAPTKRMSTYITALVAGEYAVVRDTYHGKRGDDPARHLPAGVAAGSTWTPTTSSR